MTQPDNFGFGEEAALLKASARKFFLTIHIKRELTMVKSDKVIEGIGPICLFLGIGEKYFYSLVREGLPVSGLATLMR